MPVCRCLYLLLMLALAVPGCSQSSEDDVPDDVSSVDSSAPTGEAFSMTIQTYFKQEGNYDEGRIIKEPDAAQVKGEFQALNWNDRNIRPSVKLVRMNGGKIEGMFVLRRNQESDEGNIQAEWLDTSGGTQKERISWAIDTPEQGLELLLLFHADDPKLENAVDWNAEG